MRISILEASAREIPAPMSPSRVLDLIRDYVPAAVLLIPVPLAGPKA